MPLDELVVCWRMVSEACIGGDLGEKKGDWFAEKNADDEDERFLEGVADNTAALELSCWSSIYPSSYIAQLSECSGFQIIQAVTTLWKDKRKQKKKAYLIFFEDFKLC